MNPSVRGAGYRRWDTLVALCATLGASVREEPLTLLQADVGMRAIAGVPRASLKPKAA